jgi:hypothetical protein
MFDFCIAATNLSNDAVRCISEISFIFFTFFLSQPTILENDESYANYYFFAIVIFILSYYIQLSKRERETQNALSRWCLLTNKHAGKRCLII